MGKYDPSKLKVTIGGTKTLDLSLGIIYDDLNIEMAEYIMALDRLGGDCDPLSDETGWQILKAEATEYCHGNFDAYGHHPNMLESKTYSYYKGYLDSITSINYRNFFSRGYWEGYEDGINGRKPRGQRGENKQS